MNVAAYDKKEPIYYESTATWTLSQRIIQNIGIRLALEEINKIIPKRHIMFPPGNTMCLFISVTISKYLTLHSGSFAQPQSVDG